MTTRLRGALISVRLTSLAMVPPTALRPSALLAAMHALAGTVLPHGDSALNELALTTAQIIYSTRAQ